MKLYTHPGASSLSVHILLREIGKPFDLEVVNVTIKTRADGSDYRSVASRGMVPLLELNDGGRLTENMVIAQYVCDLAGRYDLMPAAGTMDRYRVIEWQSFVAAELHKSFVPLYWPNIDAGMRDLVIERIRSRLGFVERELTGPFLTGQVFTAADAYLFVIASWTRFFKISIDEFPRLARFLNIVGSRPTVRAALDIEGPGLVSVSDLTPVP
ncbi:glutathione binding-like protein [Tardiphaga sp. P9-11]|uniref:glutathione binding-like protein n=1 Tax=Tardiphaga sp. P9-11 TaxID=2024614 RepID=UPI0011F0E9E1|nr:glutathione binding-like protein [Tardiphaga sp. P9-11]KAA0073962.1 glutathione transferase GstA [Tardiphaga sp. P9-11]